MDGSLFLILVLLASVAVIVGTMVVFVWAAQYFGRRAYRQATRRHLYVPVEARVNRVLYHRDCATLHVVYEFGRTEIVNRFLTTHDAARLAEQSKRVALLIDPGYPKDVVVAPAFERQAAASPKPMPLGARSFFEYSIRLFACLLLGGGLALALGWLKRGTVDSGVAEARDSRFISLLLVVLAVFLPLMYVTCLLLAYSRFKAKDENRLDQSEEEKGNAPTVGANAEPDAAADRGGHVAVLGFTAHPAPAAAELSRSSEETRRT